MSSQIQESAFNGIIGAYLLINKQAFLLNKNLVTIGRKLGNDLVIQNQLISRHHAEIRFQDGEFLIFDLNSTSGIYLNGKSIEWSELQSGDIFMFADIPIKFVNDSKTLNHATEEDTSAILLDK